jgi:phospholipase C
MSRILEQIEHIVVVMFENRSLDHMLGWLYPAENPPKIVIPANSAAAFNGVLPNMWNPLSAGPDNPPLRVGVSSATANSRIPNPDPQETFANVTDQIFGPGGPTAANEPMQGFVADYATTASGNPAQIMECHSTAQLPVLSALARSYAVSDAWYASVPSQTWPNRAFVHAGTSNGHVNNGNPPDPLQWDVPTIYSVLEAIGASWSVYSDTVLTPSLTRTMFPSLWPLELESHFHGFSAFVEACAAQSLPQYSFIEPSFLLEPNDQHPPHDTLAGEAFLHAIWTALSSSPSWHKTLLVITFDEHGGCFDHVLPPDNAASPDAASMPGDEGFGFDRFGIRVPTVLVSPYIAAGTVFRAADTTPYDHTSILATLRDWLAIPDALMLPSRRIAAAPTLAQVLTLSEPRSDLPQIDPPWSAALGPLLQPAMTDAPNDLQRSLVSGSARRIGLDPQAAVAALATRQHVVDFFQQNPAHPHA